MNALGRVWSGSWSRATLICLVLTAGLAFMPYVLSAFTLHVLTISAYYVILAASWNLLAGYTARFSLAQQAFAAIGSYTTGLILYHTDLPIWVGIVSSVLVATLVGVGVGVLLLRMQAAYLALATWSLAATLQISLAAGFEFTRGQLGLHVPSLLGHLNPVPYYWIFLALAAACVLVMYFIVESPVGQFMRAIKDDELRAASLGVDTTRWKVAVFGVTSAFCGLAGAFYAHYVVVLSPVIADFSEMGKIIAMTVVGGLGTFIGPIIGAPLINILLTFFQQYGSWSVVMYAVVVIVVMRFYRRGLAGLLEGLASAVSRRLARGRSIADI